MKLILVCIIVSCILASFQGCASPQMYMNSMIYSTQSAHNYAYAGPYQFQSHSGTETHPGEMK